MVVQLQVQGYTMAGIKKGEKPRGRSPRVQVSISHESNSLLEELSKVTGKSKSSYISEVFEAAVPSLFHVLDLLKKIEGMEDDKKQAVLEQMNDVEGRLLSAVSDLQQLGMFGEK